LNKNKLSAKWLIITLLLSVLATVSASVNSVHAAPVPVQGVLVEADGANGSGDSITDAAGVYNITSFLETGNYSITVSGIGFVDTIVDNIEVTAGAETTNVDVAIPVSGGISGKVSDAVSSAGLQSVYVEAANETGGVSYGSFGFTDSDGNYEIITNLATGIYNVTVDLAEGYLMKEITGVSVTAGEMTNNVDIALDRSATISGTVTDSSSSAALEGVLVYAVDSNGDYATSDVTNSSGKYTLNTNLATDTYNITIPFPDNHLAKTVTGVAAIAGSQYTVDMQLDPSGIISGIITNSADGQPVAGAFVSASSNVFFGFDSTDETGHYRISYGLGTGTYTVSTFYGLSYNETTGVTVTQGSETSGVNMELDIVVQPSGTITGRVTDAATGDPIEDAMVSAESLTGSGSATTDQNGDYIIDAGLTTGTYNVMVTALGYVPQETSGVVVIEDQVTDNVDFQLAVAPSGRISGTITTEGTVIPDFPSSLYVLAGIIAIATIAIVAGKASVPKLKASKSL
jgi:protocatechuate 3,4-dioxygenase beta subunit